VNKWLGCINFEGFVQSKEKLASLSEVKCTKQLIGGRVPGSAKEINLHISGRDG